MTMKYGMPKVCRGVEGMMKAAVQYKGVPCLPLATVHSLHLDHSSHSWKFGLALLVYMPFRFYTGYFAQVSLNIFVQCSMLHLLTNGPYYLIQMVLIIMF